MNARQVDGIAIIGVGLIGGSFGMALKKRNLAGRVIGIGRNLERLQRAAELGAVDSWSTELESAVRDADLIYVSTPVGLELDFIRRVATSAKQGCIITDAGSTKGEICHGADELVGNSIHFVGGHPMAGSEATGVEAADPDLFENAAYVLTPTERTDTDALAIVREIAEAIGSRVIVLNPEAHDRCAAVVSHLPHLMAAALVRLAHDRSAQYPEMLELIAGSFRDMTRVASSSPVLWRDICLTNIEAIMESVAGFEEALSEGLKAMESGDSAALEDWLCSAKQVRDVLFQPKRENKKIG